jgi:hypothetical protein
MEVLFELGLLLVVHWRIGLGLLTGCLAAFLLTLLAGGLGSAAAIVTVLLGLGGGMLWQITYERSKHEGSSPEKR